MSNNNETNTKKEDWMNSKWRPMMGWCYFLINIADFIVFPILWSIIQMLGEGKIESQWNPLTLQGAGLLHIAFGAILGVTAWSRGQEKLAGANNGGLSPAPQPASFSPAPQPVVQPAPQPVAPVASSFTAAPANSFTASGKKIVPQDPDPEI